MSANRAMTACFIRVNGSGGSSCSAAHESSLAIAFLRQTGLTPNPCQPPTKDSVQLIQLRLLVHHGLADRRILQI
jgi:hypothetical protein